MTTRREDLTITTHVAHAKFDEHEFCGHSVFEELAGRMTTTGLFMLALTGRRLSEEECGLVDDMIVCTAMADPRIWPLKITWTVASYGSYLAGLAAGTLALERAVVGSGTIGPAMHLLREIKSVAGDGFRDPEVVELALREVERRQKRLPGFGIPLRKIDERMEAFRKLVHARGCQNRPYWSLLESLREALLRREKGTVVNQVLAVAAVALDLGLEPSQGRQLGTLTLWSCFLANAREASTGKAEVLRRLPDQCVSYEGTARRTSPRKQRARAAE